METPWFPVDFPFQNHVLEAVAERDAPGLQALTTRFEVEQQRYQAVKRCRVMELGRPSATLPEGYGSNLSTPKIDGFPT